MHRIGSSAGVEEVIDAFAGVPLDLRTLALARGSERLLGAKQPLSLLRGAAWCPFGLE